MVVVVGRNQMVFWRWPRDFWSVISDGQNQGQVVPWPWFLQTHRVEMYKKVEAK